MLGATKLSPILGVKQAVLSATNRMGACVGRGQESLGMRFAVVFSDTRNEEYVARVRRSTL